MEREPTSDAEGTTSPRAEAESETAAAAVANAAPHAMTLTHPLVASGVAAAVGLAIVGTGASPLGPWVLCAGVIGLVVSIHRLGRLGPA